MLLSALNQGPIGIVVMLMTLFIILFSLSAHEASHAYAAKKLGDHTAYNLGRVTLNPLKHLNLFGFISMALVGIGWANPVPINVRNFKNPRKGMMLSSLAGPLSNFLIAVVSVLLEVLVVFVANLLSARGIMTEAMYYICVALQLFFYYAAFMNFSLAFFNLIPVPPFDGSRIFFYFLPKRWYFAVMKYEQYLSIGILLLFLALSRLGYSPTSYLAGGLHDLIFDPLSEALLKHLIVSR